MHHDAHHHNHIIMFRLVVRVAHDNDEVSSSSYQTDKDTNRALITTHYSYYNTS